MSTERKPSDDLREGLGLLIRAAAGVARRGVREAVKDIDVAKAVRTVGTMAEHAGQEIARVATIFEQTFEREMRVEEKRDEPSAEEPPSAEVKVQEPKAVEEGPRVTS